MTMNKNLPTSCAPTGAVRRAALAALALGAIVLPAHANDYPTFDRVMYVHECMRQHPGAHYEMVSKCSCALDKLASQLKFEEFESMVTATNATGIGGERGGAIRDVEPVQKEIRRFRDMQSAAKKSCFINVDAK
jgi:hypothetical protein